MEREKTTKEKLITWFDSLHKQVMDLKQTEAELKAANQKMANQVNRLNAETLEKEQLIVMSEQIQSCQSIDKVCSIAAQYIQKLFPSRQGALYLVNPINNLAEMTRVWGSSTSSEKKFVPFNCLAIRLSRLYQVDDTHPGQLCEHINGSKDGWHLCIPMIANDQTMGIIYLYHTKSEQDQQKSFDRRCNEHKTRLAMAAAKSIALTLLNLNLLETLHQQSIRDILTGLFNRRYLEESLTRELSRAEREKKPLGLIMFDIDHFKEFNDFYGHDGGDALLHDLGSFLIKRTRKGDIVSRYGGEEFVIVFPSASLEDTRLQAEKLRKEVKDLQIYHLDKPLKMCTISLGVAAYPEHGSTNETILKSADTALYCAKDDGRDKVVVASSI